MVDIKKYPEVIELINAAINNGKTIEIKPEKSGIAVVETARIFKNKFIYDEPHK